MEIRGKIERLIILSLKVMYSDKKKILWVLMQTYASKHFMYSSIILKTHILSIAKRFNENSQRIFLKKTSNID